MLYYFQYIYILSEHFCFYSSSSAYPLELFSKPPALFALLCFLRLRPAYYVSRHFPDRTCHELLGHNIARIPATTQQSLLQGSGGMPSFNQPRGMAGCFADQIYLTLETSENATTVTAWMQQWHVIMRKFVEMAGCVADKLWLALEFQLFRELKFWTKLRSSCNTNFDSRLVQKPESLGAF